MSSATTDHAGRASSPLDGIAVDYLCVLDFEATCNEKGPAPRPQEIIEFPALLMNVRTGEVEHEFHYYIRPDVHPTLSDFCTCLTGIAQSTIDDGISLEKALVLHQEWINGIGVVPAHAAGNDTEAPTFAYLTCGDWDLRICLPSQLKFHSQKAPSMFREWLNVKHEFQHLYGKKAGGMAGMLWDLGMELEGRHHSGIDDCRNIVRICRRMLEDGWAPGNPAKRVSPEVRQVKKSAEQAVEEERRAAIKAAREETKRRREEAKRRRKDRRAKEIGQRLNNDLGDSAP